MGITYQIYKVPNHELPFGHHCKWIREAYNMNTRYK